jgi:hypothetical protein
MAPGDAEGLSQPSHPLPYVIWAIYERGTDAGVPSRPSSLAAAGISSSSIAAGATTATTEKNNNQPISWRGRKQCGRAVLRRKRRRMRNGEERRRPEMGVY